MPFEHDAPFETEDPRTSLGAKSIHERCSAARDLSRHGTPDDIDLLIARAHEDASPAVRLGASGAVADILSRFRVGDAAGALSVEARQSWFDHFKGMDPAVNPGLFSLLACIGLPQGFRRIAVGLRDPRGDVRLGASIGLLRLCSSASATHDTELEAAVVELLRDPKLKPDAAAEVARVAARVGYRSARGAISALALEGSHGEAVDEALALLRGYDEPLSGPYFCDGRDAGEVNPKPSGTPGFAVVDEAGTLWAEGAPGEEDWTVHDGHLSSSVRRMHLRRVGDLESRDAFQLEGRTWYAADEARLLAAVDRLCAPDDIDWDALPSPDATDLAVRAAAIVVPHLPDDAAGDRARGILLLRAGDLAGAAAAFDRSVGRKKKVPADATWFQGRALLLQGDTKGGKEALQAFVKKAKKKDPRYAVAVALGG